MARKPRVEYPGALYHVMCRGNNGKYVLNKDEDKLIYLELVRKYKERYGFKLYSYCIMNNHVHLLIEMETVELSKIMQGIQQSFTQRYNKKYNRTGHVFQQRYKAVLCDKDNYLLQLIKYIHYNPVEAGIEAGLNYQWSSHNNYLKFKNDGLVEIDFVLGMFSEDYKKAHRLYEEFMNLNNGDNDIDDYTIKYESSVAMGEDIDKSSTMDIDEIIDLICLRAGVKREEIIRRSKIQKYSDTRKAIVLINDKYAIMRSTELAKKINIPISMISKIKSGESKSSKFVEELVNGFEKRKGIIQA